MNNKRMTKNKQVIVTYTAILFLIVGFVTLPLTTFAIFDPAGPGQTTGSGTSSSSSAVTGSGTSSSGTTGSGTSSSGTTGSGTSSGGTTGSGTSSSGVTVNTKIDNPLGSSITDLPSFINTIISFVLLVAIPIIVLAVIYAGFLFVTAAGNPEKLGKAKKTLLYTLIGAALLLGAFVIAKAIKGTVDCIGDNTSCTSIN